MVFRSRMHGHGDGGTGYTRTRYGSDVRRCSRCYTCAVDAARRTDLLDDMLYQCRVRSGVVVSLRLLLMVTGATEQQSRLSHARFSRATQERTDQGSAVRSEPHAATRLVEDPVPIPVPRDLTSDPVWSAAESLPWIGPQLAAVSSASSALDEVVSEGLAPLSEAAADLSAASFAPSDGRTDLAPFEAIADAAQAGDETVSAATKSVSAIDDSLLVKPVSDAVTEVDELLATLRLPPTRWRATKLILAMLDGEGSHDYLVVFQNNAEWRSLGGIIGAMAVIRTDDGALTMAAQGSPADFLATTNRCSSWSGRCRPFRSAPRPRESERHSGSQLCDQRCSLSGEVEAREGTRGRRRDRDGPDRALVHP